MNNRRTSSIWRMSAFLTYKYKGHQYLVDDIQYEDNEIPLLSAIRNDAADHILLDDTFWEVDYDPIKHTCLTDEMGYYTRDEKPYTDLSSEFMNHTQWNFAPSGRYAWNIPGIQNHTLIGFYWIPLTTVAGIIKNIS